MSLPVVIVGAGVAGLSAAIALREAGIETLILEATGRTGGRAYTIEISGEHADLGASWLHAAEHNPLTPIARRHADVLRESKVERERRKYAGTRRMSEAELSAFDAAEIAFSKLGESRAEKQPDVSLTEATAPLWDQEWTASVAYWEACLIAAADPAELSVRDWWANQLDGSNLEVSGGIGAFVQRRLVPEAGEIRLNSPVDQIMWQSADHSIIVSAAGEKLRAAACIVTVSTGVLASGRIAFDPPLPAVTRNAIEGLPMGLLSKIVLPVPAGERFGLTDGCSISQQVRTPSEPMMSFMCFPYGRNYIVGFVGGPGAWQLAAAGPDAFKAFALAQLEFALGAKAVAKIGKPEISDWAHDPAFLGAYAYARPGHFDARAALAEPIGEGRLSFAGEATRADGFAGTVGGAYLSGQQAARQIIETLGANCPA